MSGTRASVRISLSSLRTHKRRFMGTVSAVLLGVAFLAGTLVMGDTLRASFDDLFDTASSGTDTVVRSSDAITTSDDAVGTRQPVDTGLLEAIEKTPGVAAAAPSIEGNGQLLDADGKGLGGEGPPTVAGNWIADEELNAYELAEGRAPRASGEVVVNRGVADQGDLKIGDTTTLRTPDPVQVKIVGLATFAGEDGLAQVTFTGMTRADAEKYLMPEPGLAATLVVRGEPGTSQEQLTQAVAAQLPGGVEAITGEAAGEEAMENNTEQFLGLFTTLLLVFSGIALFVATFSIHNTFAIVVAQRTRENALLRALGASRRQVLGSTMIEAGVVGLLASAAGLAGGIGIAAGLQALFPAVGFPFPEGTLVISALSMLLPLAVGVVVCLGSALLPAVRAGRTAPLAALRENTVESSGASRSRALTGTVLGAGGVGLAVLGALGGGAVLLTALGALLVLIAFVVLGPVASSSAIRALGAPARRMRGISGALAQRNALRSPKRTAATATALMIGVAVVSLFTVFASSLKATMDDTVSRNFAGDVAVSTPGFGDGGSGFSPRMEPEVRQLPEVDSALGLGNGVARIDGKGAALTVTDPGRLQSVMHLGEVSGSFQNFGTDGLAVSEQKAEDEGWKVGSKAELAFADGEKQTFTVRALYETSELTGDYVVTREAWEPHRTQESTRLMVVSFKDGVETGSGQAAVERVAQGFGNPDVQTRDEYIETSASTIDMMLTLVYALLALAVFIALLGIANTLTLAVHERTRELGLLRSVGQTRAQLRSMVRWESVMIAAFGTVGGLVLGGFLSWALVTAADGQSSTPFSFAVPPVQLTVVALVGVVAGLLAGWRPARRAARLDVLRAIATE
ncbi:FtsX-like permease family protein [Streptomyces sp. N2-109]|uniref:FtsX-like permease family protein n=1 Tax=Streptomyces gossypii TaxID=2883101 RepID=A0ABT2JTX6_9ACTN|nr:FtsX-like permease family protein [Streptomyces gossypii]MCT2591347.1 FtsX-like permease family protein [Streptomyces gossypii]